MLHYVVALAAAAAAPATPVPPPSVTAFRPATPPVTDPAGSAATKAANQAAQMSMFADMAVKALDRILPPQPDPDPARLAQARLVMNNYMPAGSYSRMTDFMTDTLMNGVYNRVMAMTGTELSSTIGLPVSTGADAGLTIRQQASKGDPMFDARIAAYSAAFKDQMRETMAIMEPKLREGMARAMARRFDSAQLADLGRFFATDTGRAFGRDMMLMWIDGDVFRGAFAAMPEIMRAAPQSAARFAAIDRQYPWPKKEAAKAAAPKPATPKNGTTRKKK